MLRMYDVLSAHASEGGRWTFLERAAGARPLSIPAPSYISLGATGVPSLIVLSGNSADCTPCLRVTRWYLEDVEVDRPTESWLPLEVLHDPGVVQSLAFIRRLREPRSLLVSIEDLPE
jgi:hypothetical protein